MQVDPATSLSWIFDHLHLAFWTAALAFVWRSSNAFNKYVTNQEAIEKRTATTEQIATEIKSAVGTIKDNHLEHLAADVKEVGTAHEKSIALLQSIDKGISILVDRSTPKRGK